MVPPSAVGRAVTAGQDGVHFQPRQVVGDNLDVLCLHGLVESVDLVYLDPPFNSNANYNVLFAERDGTRTAVPPRGVRHYLWVAGDYRPISLPIAKSSPRALPLLPILLLCAISPAPRRQSGSAHRAAPGRSADLRSLSRSLLLRSKSSRHRSRTASCRGRSSPSASST